MTPAPPPGERRRSRRASDPVVLPADGVDRRTPTPQLDLLGVKVSVLTEGRALAQVSSMVERGAQGTVAFANTNLLNTAVEREDVREALAGCALILNDGAGVAWAAKVQGEEFPDNLNGTDFTPLLLERAADRGWAVALLGAAPGVAERAAVALGTRYPGLRVRYVQHGFFPRDRSAEVAGEIRGSGAELLLVGMGNPHQELWLHEHLQDTGAAVGLAVGAFIDFAAGEVPRAPQWLRRVHLEWVFRLALEPRRLFARYVIGIPVFRRRVRRDAEHPTVAAVPARRLSDRAQDAVAAPEPRGPLAAPPAGAEVPRPASEVHSEAHSAT